MGSKNELKDKLESMYTASLLGGQNSMVVCAPGWGKSTLSYNMAKQVAGSEDGVVFLPLSPSTPPEAVTGAINPAALMNGVIEYNIKHTPYDRDAHIVILDEAWRSSEVIFDLLIHATNDITRSCRPVFWGTSNFVVKSARTEALRDRFALWMYYNPVGVDVASIVNARPMSEWTFNLPTWEQVQDIRKAEFTPKARQAVLATLQELVNMVAGENFVVNPRRVEAWREILFGASVFYGGKNDFDTVPTEAMQLLRYAYPSPDEATAAKWEQVVLAIVDSVGVKIEQFLAIAYDKFNQVVSSKSASEKSAMMAQLGQVSADCISELEILGGGDSRVEEAITSMNQWFRKAAKGEAF